MGGGGGSGSPSKLFLFVVCALACLVLTVSAEQPPSLFVYDWPDLVDRYANFTDRKDAHGVEIPHWRLHRGLGRVVDGDSMEHKTSQFALHKIFYERALLDPRRTLDPAQATSFFVPFDIGMHTAFLESNGRMRRSNCPSAPSVIQRLNASVHFARKMGHDHIVVFALNQNMNYFMAGQVSGQKAGAGQPHVSKSTRLPLLFFLVSPPAPPPRPIPPALPRVSTILLELHQAGHRRVSVHSAGSRL